MSCTAAELPWQELFRDPLLHSPNHRSITRNGTLPDFRPLHTKPPPFWVRSLHNPRWVREKPKHLLDTHTFSMHKAKDLPHVKELEGRKSLLVYIKSCGREKNIGKVRALHAYLLEKGSILKDAYVTTALMHTYAKCGLYDDARELFEGLPVRNVVSWNALISGYAHSGHGNEAIECFQQMKEEGISPDRVTFTCVLRACGCARSIEIGEQIHLEIRKQGLLQKDLVLGNTLIDMYAKCGKLGEALEVFKELAAHDVISWNALISGYAQQNRGDEALKCFQAMRDENIAPTAITFTLALKACASLRCLEVGEEIYEEVRKLGLLEKDFMLGTALVDLYAKCGKLEKAREAFEQLPRRDIVSWNALMAGYAQHDMSEEALKCFRRMQDEGIFANPLTFISVLKACGSAQAFDMGQEIHAEVKKQGLLKKDPMLGSAVVDMYAKCDMMELALEVFEELPMHDVVAWNALMGGYAQNGLGNEALKCFRRMEDAAITPNKATFIWLLKACGSIGNLEMGEEICTKIRKQGLVTKDIMLGTALVDMYGKCGVLEKAQEVFQELSVHDIVTWSALIAGYAKHGFYDEALKCFRQMQGEGIPPDTITFTNMLKVCGSQGSLETGEEIHMLVKKQGLIEKNIVVGTALVDMYAKCGMLEKAQEVFEELPVKDVTCWNLLLAGYVQHGHNDAVIRYFEQMKDEDNARPDAATFSCVLKACGATLSLSVGEAMHIEARRQGLLATNLILGTALMDMYAKCGLLEKACEVFQELPARDSVCWNALVSAYAQHGLPDDALKCYSEMRREGILPDVVTCACILKVCGTVGSVEMGGEIHAEAQKQDLQRKSIELGMALVDMYAKCGMMGKAQAVFDELPHRDAATWNALISGYGQLVHGRKIVDSVLKMWADGITPDAATFLIWLNACSHTGLVEEGQKIFNDMYSICGLAPASAHYACMVDLFGRAGHFDKAKAILGKVAHGDRLPLLLALLGSCCKWINVDLGMWVFKQSIELDEKCTAAYVCMRNLYAAAGMKREAEEIEACRVKMGT